MNLIIYSINLFNDFFWKYIGFFIICITGLYLTLYTKGLQFRALWNMRANLSNILSDNISSSGIHPFKLIFASAGGMIGIGNIVGIGTAVSIGGPGAILWIWVGSFCGMLIKYSEIYLSMQYRIPNNDNSYDGGLMFYVHRAFNSQVLAMLSAVLLCVYGIEIYQFVVLVDRFEIVTNHYISREIIVITLTMGVLYASIGGIKRLANICSVMMPFFMSAYIIIGIYIILCNASSLPNVLYNIFYSAFNGQAAVGGFAGSTVGLCAYYGVSRGVYAGDIGVGSDSIVHSESREQSPDKQAKLAIYTLFGDTLICTVSTMLIAVTGAWRDINLIKSDAISIVINSYIPYGNLFMTGVLFFAGFTTIIAFLTIGIKSAKYISPKYGKTIYTLLAIPVFISFSYISQNEALTIMTSCAGLLILINIAAILKLHRNIQYR